MRTIAITSAVIAAAALTSASATAQPWRPSSSVRNEIRQDISQLEDRISRAHQRGTVSRREAARLREEASGVRRLYGRYSRNGLSRAEVSTLERHINEIHREIRASRRDWGGRR